MFPDEIRVLGMAESAQDAYTQIKRLRPNLVFFDANLLNESIVESFEEFIPQGVGYVLTNFCSDKTARILEGTVFGHLLLPTEPKLLTQMVNQLAEVYSSKSGKKQRVQTNLSSSSLKRIAIPDNEGISMIDLDKILRCEADSNYTKIYLLDGTRLVSAKTLKEYDNYLSMHQFFRVHQSHLINLRFVKRYVRGDGGTVILWDGTQIEVARRKKQEFVEKLFTLA
jgi:two-component system LytT family response regulator